ncbi:DUF6338 family protein, partial [Actinoplanes sp. NPDC051633]|uniref:DUF6338 family protein n=1 Tax=Actinoplanes sp. NPDC051633 TaxID=3155670 RepID=UPI0034474D74
DPRLVRGLHRAGQAKVVRTLFGHRASDIREVSTWHTALDEYKANKEGRTIVGALQEDGAYVQGTLLASTAGTVDYDKRELLLTGPLTLTTTDGKTHCLSVQMTIIAARNLRRLDITHTDLPSDPVEINTHREAEMQIPPGTDIE